MTQADGSEREEGIRLTPFLYSGKEIMSIGKWEQKVQEELNRVKALPSDKRTGWVKNLRPQGVLYEEDDIAMLPRVGRATKSALNSVGIEIVRDLFLLDREQCPPS